MDPPLVNDTSFSAANPASYTLTGIWPFPPINGDAVVGGLGLRVGNFSGGYGDLDLSVEESTVTGQSIGGGCGNGRKRRDLSSEDESSKLVSTSSSANKLNGTNSKRMKVSGSLDGNRNSKAEGAVNSAANKKSSEQTSEPPKQDYIHVRARRGQATDSHSLAERARREKISERMKTLQDLVPGCNKVIGKALVLDEIINYVQSLQRQVEFLSMKLEAVNSRMNVNPAIEGFHPKDEPKKQPGLYLPLFYANRQEMIPKPWTQNSRFQVGAQPFDAAGMIFGPQPSRDYGPASLPEWLHMQIGGNFERTA